MGSGSPGNKSLGAENQGRGLSRQHWGAGGRAKMRVSHSFSCLKAFPDFSLPLTKTGSSHWAYEARSPTISWTLPPSPHCRLSGRLLREQTPPGSSSTWDTFPSPRPRSQHSVPAREAFPDLLGHCGLYRRVSSTARVQGLSVSPLECKLHENRGLGLSFAESQYVERYLAQSRRSRNLCGMSGGRWEKG